MPCECQSFDMTEIHTVDINLMRNEEFEEKGIRIKRMKT